MEEIIRNNVIEFSLIYLDQSFENIDSNDQEFDKKEFTSYIFKQLFNKNICEVGYGKDFSTMQMTNNLGDLKIYNENDPNKINYISDIKRGDLVFFHTKDLEENSPTPSNHYPGHVGIYLGNNEFIHVSPIEEKITIDKLADRWLNTLVASRDIIKELAQNITL